MILASPAPKTFLGFCAFSCSRCVSKLNGISMAQSPVFMKSKRHMSGEPWSLHRLKSRGVLELKGPDTVPFLQGLVTNEMTELEERRVQYNMLLNVQGRVMFDLLLYHIPTSDNVTVLMECERAIANKLMLDIKKFKIRKKVSIEDKSEKLDVVGAVSDSECASESPTVPGTVIRNRDPRVPTFGERIIVDREISGELSVLEDEAGYHERRYRWGIPEGTADLPPGNCFPLESNLVYMNGVCFTKGCYLGQELTARTYHTGVTRKRLMPLTFKSCPGDIGAGETIRNEQGKNVGKFRNRQGIYGLGLLRIGEVAGPLQVTTTSGQLVTVNASVPSWWPSGS